MVGRDRDSGKGMVSVSVAAHNTAPTPRCCRFASRKTGGAQLKASRCPATAFMVITVDAVMVDAPEPNPRVLCS